MPITKTVRGVVIDHADGLHEGVDDSGAYEGETALFQVFADFLREGSLRWDFIKCFEVIDDR